MIPNDTSANDQERPIDGTDEMPDALRWQLRGLREDVAPQRDLWAGIAERIAAGPQVTQPAPIHALPRPSRRLRWMAMAASIGLAFALAWQLRPTPVTAPAPTGSNNVAANTISREAAAMTQQYQTALREIDAHGHPVTAHADALRELDAGVQQVRDALTRDPDSSFLLRQLQKLYTQRLALTQRFAMS